MDEYKHYIRIDVGGIVTHGFTDAFEQPQGGDLLLSGQDGRHFTIQLTNERGQYMYKIVNGTMSARTQEELDAEWETRPPAPKTPDQLEKEQMNMSIIEIWESIIPLLPA